ncbi:hypothetical protein IP91_01696 [Pseudoduganella lurida]|uniref:Flagellar hook-length control protein FliK n=1 Tax=Pseudoduganella lurida TaxID=1036180 RepID=A0A562RET3_9BURK|nr:hypothetical protein [Pseudoduganella lurida]TWI67579.1 hypothetical protein IP91_01696 [Pseudoduganella lurida]
MAIDRVTPSSAALTIPERIAREQPGTAQAVPPVARPPDDAPPFALDAGLPGAVGALLEAMEGKPTAAPSPAALAGRLAAAETLLDETMSMQPNQLFLSRQLVPHAAEPSALAASWLAMVRTYAEQRGALDRQADGRHLPASLFLSDQAPHVLRDGRVPPQLVAELDAWRFAVYAWGAEKLVLRVVTRKEDEDDEGGPAHRRGRPRMALRLELHLPGLGKVVLQIVPGDGGVLLEIGAAQTPALQHMRLMLPEIGAIATRCGVRVLRVRLVRELADGGSPAPGQAQLAMLTPDLFRAMAEMAVLLSQPVAAPA